jgi:hypothetical protein
MPFPAFDFCIICEGLRPEMGGKLTILGFYGLAPNVEVVVSNPALPVTLALIAGFPPIADTQVAYESSTIVTRPNQAVILQTPLQRLNVSAVGRGFVAAGFIIPPPHVFGLHSIRIVVNRETKLDTAFRLRGASPGELAALGVFPNPAAAGRTN